MIEGFYIKHIKEFDKNKKDNESAHIIQDKIYKRFINDIVNNRLNQNEIKVLAKIIKKKIIKYDVNRWYS